MWIKNEKYLIVELEPVNVWGRKIKMRIILDPISGALLIPETRITSSSYTEWERIITYDKNVPTAIVISSFRSDGVVWKITMMPDIRINANITEYTLYGNTRSAQSGLGRKSSAKK